MRASGRSGRLISSGSGFDSSQTILVGAAHPLSISPQIDRVATSSGKRILRGHKLFVLLPALVRSKHGGLKLNILKLDLSTVVSKKKADDAGGKHADDENDSLDAHLR